MVIGRGCLDGAVALGNGPATLQRASQQEGTQEITSLPPSLLPFLAVAGPLEAELH